MLSHVLNAEVCKPDALDLARWAPIQDCLTRLRNAAQSDDRPSIVGSSKDLAEAVARVVLAVRGQLAASGEGYDKVLGDAHRAIEYQPGDGLAPDAPVRQAANAAKRLAAQLRELRNFYGTGHGRAALPVIEDEVLEICVDGALLWTRWALRRLQNLIIGDLQPLIADLYGATFTMGSLASRLRAADLPSLQLDDQRALGLAVGQRAATNTFTVRVDGVEACAKSQDAAAWPVAYREGVAEGLFLDRYGQVRVDEQVRGPRLAAELLAPHPEQTRVAAELEAKLTNAAWSSEFVLIWRQVVGEMRLVTNLLQDHTAQQAWLNIIEHFNEVGEGS